MALKLHNNIESVLVNIGKILTELFQQHIIIFAYQVTIAYTLLCKCNQTDMFQNTCNLGYADCLG